MGRTYNTNKERERRMRDRYGITVAIYEDMFVAQGGVCKICKVPPWRMLVVDHCHKTLKVRGLLCHECNTALGKFKDDTYRLQEAINYLKESE